jgi:hypothetical protein
MSSRKGSTQLLYFRVLWVSKEHVSVGGTGKSSGLFPRICLHIFTLAIQHVGNSSLKFRLFP